MLLTETQIYDETDEEILSASLEDPEMFGVLIERLEAPFMRKAVSILRNRDEAEDAVQETFTKMYLHAGRFERVPGASLRSWGYRILVNTCLSRYRTLKRRNARIADVPDDIYAIIPDARELDAHAERELADYVASIMTRVPKTVARVLSGYFLEGKTHRELAAEEGVSEQAMKTRMYRAKKIFAEAAHDVE